MLFHYQQRVHLQLIKSQLQLSNKELEFYNQRRNQGDNGAEIEKNIILKVRKGCVRAPVRIKARLGVKLRGASVPAARKC